MEEVRKLALTISVIPCLNCGGQFYPKSDTGNFTNIRCGSCYYEAWFHYAGGKMRQVVFSIDTDDIDRILVQKIVLPPIILYWDWVDNDTKIHWEVAQLYPFIPQTFLRATDTSVSLGGQPNTLTVFLQSDELLPNMTMFQSPSDKEIAEVVSGWQDRSASAIEQRFSRGFSWAYSISELVREIRRKKGIDEEEEDN